MTRHLLTLALCIATGGCGGCDDDSPACKGAQCQAVPCDGGVCQTASVTGIPNQARACEALVEVAENVTWSARFADGVEGRMIAEGPRVALAFTRTTDEPFPADAVALELQSAESAGLSLSVSKGACFDSAGEEISDVELAFGP